LTLFMKIPHTGFATQTTKQYTPSWTALLDQA